MFSAIAVMAFTISSVAANEPDLCIEELIEIKKIEDFERFEIQLIDRNCFDYAILIYNGTLSRGKSVEFAIDLSEWAYNDCLEWD
jgi:hypothetical protein